MVWETDSIQISFGLNLFQLLFLKTCISNPSVLMLIKSISSLQYSTRTSYSFLTCEITIFFYLKQLATKKCPCILSILHNKSDK